MKLDCIYIDAYRSVVDQSIVIDHRFKVLVGINEGGKSNVLRAIRSIEKDSNLTTADTPRFSNRKPHIRFRYELDEDDFLSLKSEIDNWLVLHTPFTSFDEVFFVETDKPKYADRHCKIDIDDTRRDYLTFTLNARPHAGMFIHKNFDNVSDGLMLLDGIAVSISTHLILDSLENVFSEDSLADFQSLSDDVASGLIEHILGNIDIDIDLVPSVTYWEFDSNSVIPPTTDFEELLRIARKSWNSSILVSLLQIASHVGVSDFNSLQKKVSLWQKTPAQRQHDGVLLTTYVNEYIRSIWKDANVSLLISIEEDKIVVHFRDSDDADSHLFTMAERSDGLKQFVSFIISMNMKTNPRLQDHILVLDEPETHLHPSSVRYLREELARMTESGLTVIVATHSVFMIDRSNLTRHVIVKKQDGMSTLQQVTSSRITQEATIYESLGTSIDEFSFAPVNIIFEGESDFILAECFLKCYDITLNSTRLLDGGGTKAIKTYLKEKVFQSDCRWITVLDNDSAGRELEALLLKKSETTLEKDVYSVYRYSDIPEFELEDLLPIALLNEVVTKVLGPANVSNLDIAPFNRVELFSSYFDSMAYKVCAANGADKKFLHVEFKKELIVHLSKTLGDIVGSNARKEKFEETFPEYSKWALELRTTIESQCSSSEA